MKNIKVGIVGATGYTALEVARLLQSHPRRRTGRRDESIRFGKAACGDPSIAGGAMRRLHRIL